MKKFIFLTLILILIPVFWFMGVKNMSFEEMINEFKLKGEKVK